MLKSIEVPTELYLRWMNRLGPVPSQYGGAVWASMEELLGAAIDSAARDQIDRHAA